MYGVSIHMYGVSIYMYGVSIYMYGVSIYTSMASAYSGIELEQGISGQYIRRMLTYAGDADVC
jgi:hypothetical protein